ncbi:MAG TPA: hypothetical protein GXX75_23415 [Clostridiales bacterium]|nr:hypothetical protein [Clostridiales bacterium]
MRQKKSKNPVNIILRDPGANDKRKCRDCECRNDKGYCDNYFLHAVIRQVCRQPVKEAT